MLAATPGAVQTLPAMLGEIASALAVPVAVMLAVWLLANRLVAVLARIVTWITGRRDPVVSSVRTGRQGMIGRVGVVRAPLAPRGKVFVRGELWDAVADEPVAARREVEVIGLDGLTLQVAPRPTTDSPTRLDESTC